MGDRRVAWGKDLITLRQDKRNTQKFKVGTENRRGWAAYACHGCLFVKRFPFIEGAVYPDGGMNFETFTNNLFLEMESLSPLREMQPGETAEHEETWEILDDVKAPRAGDFAAAAQLVARLIE